jgi:GNAT superfamily N-acetyltransferase
MSHVGTPSNSLGESIRAGGQLHELPRNYSYLAIVRPNDLLGRHCGPLRDELISVSDQAFGTDTARTWHRRFEGDFFRRLDCFYLILDPHDALIGWSGYRAHTICGERVVYFDSTGLLPDHQGQGLIPRIQRAALELERSPDAARPINLVVRTRNQAAYRLAINTPRTEPVIPACDGIVPEPRRTLVAATASWLGQSPFDPTTGRVTGAYSDRPALYGPGCHTDVGDPQISRLFASLGPVDALLLFARHAPAAVHGRT